MRQPREWVAPAFLAREIILSRQPRAWRARVHHDPGKGQCLVVLLIVSLASAHPSSSERVHPVAPVVPVLPARVAPAVDAPEDPVARPVVDAPVRVVAGAAQAVEPRERLVAAGVKTNPASRSGLSAKSLKCAKRRASVE